jgi:hypothetical protein
MNVQANQIYHLYNVGNNGQQIFKDKESYRLFLELFQKYTEPYCDIICWGLVPKKFEFMVKIKESGDEMIQVGSVKLSRFANAMRITQSLFARMMNRRLGKSGSYFKCKCKAELVEGSMYSQLFDTIHSSPWHSGYVTDETEWPFSSCADYKKGRKFDLCNFEIAKELLGNDKCVAEPKGFFVTISKATSKIVIGSLRGRDFYNTHMELHKVRYRS